MGYSDSVYIQLPLCEAVLRYPQLSKMLPPFVDVRDSRYYVRINSFSFEIGFLDDDWIIN